MASLNDLYLRHLGEGGTLLTANRRQARLIRRLFDARQAALGLQVWPSAQVLPLDAWAAARWHEAASVDASLPLLLGEAQAAWPWRAAALEQGDGTLIDAAELAAAARRSWLTLVRYGGSLDALARQSLTRDQRRFLAWARAVERQHSSRGWLDPGRLETALAAQVSRLERGAPLLLAGFRRPEPAVRHLVGALVAAGWQVDVAPVTGQRGAPRGHAAEDPDAELGALAAWARERLQANPTGRYAAIVPDLDQRRTELERRLEAVLQPRLELPGSAEDERIFDLAGGPALSGLAIVEAALGALGAGRRRLDMGLISSLLGHRHLGRADEADARARLDIELRTRRLAAWPVAALAAACRQGGCPAFADALSGAHEVLARATGKRPADAWAECFGQALAAWGWPGPGALASDEFQAAQALRERLVDFAGLARTAPAMDQATALGELTRAAQAPFQPERGEAALVILDTLDAPGLEFDGVWVAGLTAAAWPRAATPDPLLPLSLQHALGVPGATPANALAEAIEVTAAWQAGGSELVLSWPCSEDDARVEPSRVLPAALEPLPPPPAFLDRTRRLLAASVMEVVTADPAPPLVPGAARGGARILELQARCPFRAYAELRLAAARLEEPTVGVDPRMRGTALHRALELAWKHLGGAHGLASADAAEVEELVAKSVATALAETLPPDIGPEARRIERDWQQLAVAAELAAERERPDFEVASTEGEIRAVFAGLPLRLRADRVDRVGAGLAILDYKTGAARSSQWRGARPDAPQLPLYAVLAGDQVGSVAFAAVSARGAHFDGVGHTAGLLPGVVAAGDFPLTDDRQKGFDWDTLRARWAAWLTALATSHLEGDARVDPKTPAACRQCHLAVLCRVEPGAGEEEGGDE